MKVDFKKLPKSEIEISFEIPWEEFKPYADKAYSILGKDVVIKGFRKGNVPKDILEKEIGQDKILEQAADLIAKDKYPQAIYSEGIEPISQPEVSITKLAKDNPFEFKVKISVLPNVVLPDYKTIASKIEKKEISIIDKDVNDALKWIQQSRAVFTPLDRGAEKDDFVEIEYQSPQIESNKIFNDKFLLGKAKLAPGFEENLEGMKKDEQKEFSIVFPKEHNNKVLAGKNIFFKVKMKSVQKMEVPELNDELASKLGAFKDLAFLKESIKENLKKEKELEQKQKTRNEVLGKIAQDSKCKMPESLIENEKKNLLEDLKQRVDQGIKIPFEKYLKQIKKTEKEIKDSFADAAEKRVKNFLALREIGKKEEIKVSKQEIEEGVNKTLKNYPNKEDVKKIDIERLKDYTESAMYNEKVFERLESFIK
jgi:trigger factor